MRLWLFAIKKAIQNKMTSQTLLIDYLLCPCLNICLFYYMNRSDTIEPFQLYANVMILTLWQVNIFDGSYLIIDERTQGTLYTMLLSHYPLYVILLIEQMSSLLLNLPIILIIGLWIEWLSPFAIAIPSLIQILCGYVLCIVSISQLSLCLSSLLIYARTARGIVNAMEYLLYIASGLLIHTPQIPQFLKPLHFVLPTSYAFLLFSTTLTSSPANITGTCLLLNGILGICNVCLLQYLKKKLLTSGTMDQF